MNWFKRIFTVISAEEAKKLGLKHITNIYGDMINKINCRSIYKDSKGRQYRVRELKQNL